MSLYVQFLRKTAATWTSDNTVLKAGQMGVETDTRKAKFGDGTTAWNSLTYMWSPTGAYAPGGTDVAITDGGTGVSTLPSGLLKGAGTGAITAATAVTDYALPLFLAQLNTTQTTSNTTTDTTHWTPANVAAGSLSSGVTCFRARIGGNFDNKATSGTFTGRLKINTTTVASIPIAISQTSLQTATTWWVDMDVYIDTTGAGGVVSVLVGAIEVTNAAAGQNPRAPHTIATSVNLTAGCQFTWTVQMGTADVANITRTFRGIIQQLA